MYGTVQQYGNLKRYKNCTIHYVHQQYLWQNTAALLRILPKTILVHFRSTDPNIKCTFSGNQ